ncbi:hypothetical protein CDD82_580 [Ophiocordyceps australis]|uniref:G-patch domain-containing protein n=1 Tax=Ophiocordyceps australis TaxID=1399860 RepID=A0A2C5Y0T0_9HYPO|nr:hypothetical protein CDD82_580 [Ophiocordyceps australis]
MPFKRSRSTFETDHHVSFAVYGSPLPQDDETRDDGSYLPLWKQEVRDERGRKRLHGAFTGGFSAGYFNTVGSKEGWTPSAFVSSRANRHKNTASAQQRAEDYMDEEDLADKAEADKIQTSEAFAGMGSSVQSETSHDVLGSLLKATGNTIGLRLLRRMGWKDGQGIGPKVRRTARLDPDHGTVDSQAEMHLFAPDDVPMIQFSRKKDRKGLGYRGEAKLQGFGSHGYAINDDQDDDNEGEGFESDGSQLHSLERSKPRRAAPGAFGVGVLNDTGSDDENPYEMGPKIKYNRVLGGDKKKKQKKRVSSVANPTFAKTPKYVPTMGRIEDRLGRSHDGRPPLRGFVMAKLSEDFGSLMSRYAPPPVPLDWKTALEPSKESIGNLPYISTADAAKASKYNPQSRAAVLGEQALPGKSVFDYLSVEARDKIAAASGKTNLPQAGGDDDEETEEWTGVRHKALWDQVPKLDGESAAAALARISNGPYADDEAKRGRYRRYLEQVSGGEVALAQKPAFMAEQDFVQELHEFYNCARIFKPMTGFMASRFTTSKAAKNFIGNNAAAEVLSRPEAKMADGAEEAAKMGMFGHLTRSVVDFYPTRLLCKRFNVRAPAHARPDNMPDGNDSKRAPGCMSNPVRYDAAPLSPPRHDGGPDQTRGHGKSGHGVAHGVTRGAVSPEQTVVEAIDAHRNEAVEAAAANAEVLGAIFGESDDGSE